MARVDYDRIAHLYDERARDHVVDEELLNFLSRKPDSSESVTRILDIGCGTGKQLAADRGRLPGIALVGLDRFQNMLRLARQRCPEVTWVQGDGASLPLLSRSCDYVTSQFSYQHVRNTERLLAEVFRVLRPRGRFVMTNIDPWSMTEWAIYRYFPEALMLDREDFLPVERFVDLMTAAGFEHVSARREDRPTWRDVQQFRAFASDRHRASQLMAISDDAYDAGIRRLERAIAADADAAGTPFTSQFVIVTILGDKSSAD
jgi:SAM-dependent methyltransferase